MQSDPASPRTFESCIDSAIHALEAAKLCPKVFFKGCSGIVLIRAEEGGVLVSAQGGKGVLVSHKDGIWSNPVAVDFGGLGGGAVLGYAEKDIVIFLNPFAKKCFIESQGGHAKLNVDFGLTMYVLL